MRRGRMRGQRSNHGRSEWTENEISLKDFAGKNIYVAFVNNNNNQSAIFLDDVEVSRDLDLSIALFTPEYLVGKDEMEVSGHMQNLSSNNIDELTLNLKAADGSVVDKMGSRVSDSSPTAFISSSSERISR